MGLETGTLSEVSQKEKRKYHMIALTCGLLKMVQTYLQNRNRVADVEKKPMVTWRATVHRVAESDTTERLSTGSSTQYSVMTYMGKQSDKSGYAVYN